MSRENDYQLINLAIHEQMGRRSQEPARGTLGDRIRDYVAEHLHDPHLSLDSIARHLNSSKRSLHRAVSDLEQLHSRPHLASASGSLPRDLLDPAKSRQTIAEIAHSWGFKNFTHFSRAFREPLWCVSARGAPCGAEFERLTSIDEGRTVVSDQLQHAVRL